MEELFSYKGAEKSQSHYLFLSHELRKTNKNTTKLTNRTHDKTYQLESERSSWSSDYNGWVETRCPAEQQGTSA